MISPIAPSPQSPLDRRNIDIPCMPDSQAKLSTNTPAFHMLRLKTPAPTKARKAESTSNAYPADLQTSLPPRIHPGGNAKSQRLHVQLSFTLYQNGTQRNPTQKELEEIFSVFPTCIGVMLMNPLLILQFETLPDRPWPLTIAGMPVYLTTHPEEFPLELGLLAAGAPLKLPCELQRWKTPSVNAMHQLFEAFDERKIDIKGFQWLGVRLLGEVNAEAPLEWRSYFPRRVNDIAITYVFNNDIETPGSLGLKTPTEVEPDDGNYSNMLRPGVILSSGIGVDGSELQTTSGICVESPSGTKFVTCASHGFPLGLEDAYHPSAAGPKVRQ